MQSLYLWNEILQGISTVSSLHSHLEKLYGRFLCKNERIYYFEIEIRNQKSHMIFP